MLKRVIPRNCAICCVGTADRYVDGIYNGYRATYRYVAGTTDGCVDGTTDGCVDGTTDIQVGGTTDRCVGDTTGRSIC